MSDTPVLFTRTGCTGSMRARTWLVEHGVEFRECDIDRETEKLRGMKVTAAPLLAAGTSAVFGYRPFAFAELFGVERRTNASPIDRPSAILLRAI